MGSRETTAEYPERVALTIAGKVNRESLVVRPFASLRTSEEWSLAKQMTLGYPPALTSCLLASKFQEHVLPALSKSWFAHFPPHGEKLGNGCKSRAAAQL
jgi:hypothetical protein